MAQVAANYYSGKDGFPEDDARAFFWSQKAAEVHPTYAFGWEMLGRCYEFGVGVSADALKAIAAYQKSVDLGNTDILYNLAELYFFDAADKDKPKCVPLLERAYAAGDRNAAAMLGQMYAQGDLVSKDSRRGFKLLEEAAVRGDAHSAYVLADKYWLGKGVSEDTEKGNYYCTMAVDNGEDNPRALLYAGFAWFRGIGVARDFAKARKCFEKNLVDDEADAILGCMCFEGVGGPVDRAEGEKRLRKAMKSDELPIALDAMNNLGLYFYTASERLPEAIALFREAAEKGNANAQVNLGKAYYEGKGVAQDERTAAHYFSLAAKQGNQTAIDNLKSIHLPPDSPMDTEVSQKCEQKGEDNTVRYVVGGILEGGILGGLLSFLLLRDVSSLLFCVVLGGFLGACIGFAASRQN